MFTNKIIKGLYFRAEYTIMFFHPKISYKHVSLCFYFKRVNCHPLLIQRPYIFFLTGFETIINYYTEVPMNTNILKLIFNTLEEALIILDEQSNVIFANEQFYSLSDTTEASVISHNFYTLNDNIFDIPSLRQLLTTFPLLGKLENASITIKFKNGSTKLLQFTAHVFETPIDKNIILKFRDVTNQKYTEEQLLRLNKAVASSEDIIFMTDCNGVFTYINPQFTNVYGYTEDEVIRKQTPRILKSGMMQPEVYKTVWESLTNKNNSKGEFVNKTKGGKHVVVDFSANPILDETGTIIGFLAIQKNITERKKQEEALVRSEEKYKKFLMMI